MAQDIKFEIKAEILGDVICAMSQAEGYLCSGTATQRILAGKLRQASNSLLGDIERDPDLNGITFPRS